MSSRKQRGFSLIETLVVTSVAGLLMGILLPVLSRAREQAKVTAVNAELRQIGLCLEMYMQDNAGQHPPTRQDCAMGWDDHALPPELVAGHYLPAPDAGTGMSAGIEDRFNPGHTYRYRGVGSLYQNNMPLSGNLAFLYVPKGFPHTEGPADEDLLCYEPDTSPVTWVAYSLGPIRGDREAELFRLFNVEHGPVAGRTWYDPATRTGLLVRVRLANGRHIGSFEGRP